MTAELHSELAARGITLGVARAKLSLGRAFDPRWVSQRQAATQQRRFPTLKAAVGAFERCKLRAETNLAAQRVSVEPKVGKPCSWRSLFLDLLPFGLLDRSTRIEISESKHGRLRALVNRYDHERHQKIPSSERLKEAHMRTMTFSTTALVAMYLSLGPAGAAETISADAVADALGFSSEQHAKLQAGEIVSTEIEETTEKQLAVALALKVPATLEDVAASVAEGITLETNKAIKAYGEIDPAAVSGAALADITLDAAEIEKLLEVEPGSEYNLSADEIAIFHNLAGEYDAGDPGAADAVNAAWRQVLAGRLQAYLQGGLNGIAPYDRGGDDSSAADDLRSAAEASKLVQQAVPELYQAFLAYPNQSVADVEHRFFWTEQVADGRPVYTLIHRMAQQRPDMLVVLLRDFYASHSFNASQGAAGALPVEDGVVIFYGNRTSSDQVAGFMSGMRHEIGRGMMRDSLVEAMEDIRATWQR